MSNINRDLDRYLSKRKSPASFKFSLDSKSDSSEEKSWLGGFMKNPKEAPSEELSKDEEEKLEEIEADIVAGEERIEKVQEFEHELEEEQEERVSLYHQVLGFFKRGHKEPEDNFEEMDDVKVYERDDVTEDFRALASIQVKWLERLPKRHKDAFRESEDYDEFTEILQRRGVARRK